jgi:hypothetical protein
MPSAFWLHTGGGGIFCEGPGWPIDGGPDWGVPDFGPPPPSYPTPTPNSPQQDQNSGVYGQTPCGFSGNSYAPGDTATGCLVHPPIFGPTFSAVLKPKPIILTISAPKNMRTISAPVPVRLGNFWGCLLSPDGASDIHDLDKQVAKNKTSNPRDPNLGNPPGPLYTLNPPPAEQMGRKKGGPGGYGSRSAGDVFSGGAVVIDWGGSSNLCRYGN